MTNLSGAMPAKKVFEEVLPRTVEKPAVSPGRAVRLEETRSSPVLPFDNGQQAAAEQYKIIRTKILHHFRKPKFILVSSAASGDGKTITSINLAASFALKLEASVLLIDGDMRRPSVARSLGIASVPGLTDVLTGRVELDAALVHSPDRPNLAILPAGQPEESAAELLDSANWRALVGQARARFSYVICDAPPIATVADYELLQMVADGAVVVARPDHTERSACLEALGSVDQSKLLGVVLNCVEDWWLWKTPSYGYYGKDGSRNAT